MSIRRKFPQKLECAPPEQGGRRAVLDDADLVRERMDVDHPAAGCIGDTMA